MRIGFIGLGAMGWHMAGHLTQLDATVMVWNRTKSKAEAHAAQFGTVSVDLDLLVQADFIFSCLPTSSEVEAILSAHPPKSGSIWIDCTSGIPFSAQQLSQSLKRQGVEFLDAPVSGQTIGAENATLTVMVGGHQPAFERARPVIQAFAGVIEHVGESGSGFAVKAVNNILMAANLWALSEGLSVLKVRGVSLDAALACINHSSGKSSMSETVMPQKIMSRCFNKTFALNLLQKDIGIALDLIAETGQQGSLLHCVQQLYNQIDRQTAEHIDFSAAIQMLEQYNQVLLN
ncbi:MULTISPECIES: NAD(P)-dependent oxidoreductase [unclassified Acinetobacter]|uniref:NAD(P)-dependent oxidoreductase n=1 Tax=unclassified Acinetobacter TaxID=196816 RepID=UPI00190E380A|nr:MULTISPECIES: NAD(P)-dependent oxidoreductase [unclassified Acinetobacter]MBK0064309.1 NAD(P)-dependent oxidoreductase [Acinetobacter sp. S55]MBK0067699.1 NAD(P)-dependent oxidoreductase [Acinetobacter sp. S54]